MLRLHKCAKCFFVCPTWTLKTNSANWHRTRMQVIGTACWQGRHHSSPRASRGPTMPGMPLPRQRGPRRQTRRSRRYCRQAEYWVRASLKQQVQSSPCSPSLCKGTPDILLARPARVYWPCVPSNVSPDVAGNVGAHTLLQHPVHAFDAVIHMDQNMSQQAQVVPRDRGSFSHKR